MGDETEFSECGHTFHLSLEGGIDRFYIYFVICQILGLGIKLSSDMGILGDIMIIASGPKSIIKEFSKLWGELDLNKLISKLSKFLSENLERKIEGD